MSKVRGRLVVFEGLDGSGKSTIAREAARTLARAGVSTRLAAFPGLSPGTLGVHIHRLYHHPKRFRVTHRSVLATQLLFTAAHVDVIEGEVLPSLARGETVLLDRYWWSTWVYARQQGLSTGVVRELLSIESAVWGTVQPELLILLSRHADSGVRGNTRDKLRKLYDSLSRTEARRTRVVRLRNDSTIDNVVERVLRLFERRES